MTRQSFQTDSDTDGAGRAGAVGSVEIRAPQAEQSGPRTDQATDRAAMAAAASSAGPRRRRGLTFAVLLAATALIGWGGLEGWSWWTDGRFMVETDDAYVGADITTLAAKVPGYVKSVDVTANQSVKAGDALFHLDDGDYRLALASADNRIAAQEATIARVGKQVDAAQAAVASAEAEIASSNAKLAQAEADFARQQQLFDTRVSATANLDEARAARDQAEAAVDAAKAGLQSAKATVAVFQAQLVEAESARADLRTQRDKAARDLDFTVIRAPVDGVVANRAVEEGAYVQPGQRLAALVPLSAVHVDANFKETQMDGIRPGARVAITVDALPGRRFEGQVESIAPATGSVFSLLPAQNATGNFTKIVQRVPVRVSVPASVAAEGLLRPGLSAVVAVDSRSAAPAVAAAD